MRNAMDVDGVYGLGLKAGRGQEGAELSGRVLAVVSTMYAVARQ